MITMDSSAPPAASAGGSPTTRTGRGEGLQVQVVRGGAGPDPSQVAGWSVAMNSLTVV